MESLKKILVHLFVIFGVFKCYQLYRIGSRCGYPGLPHETKINPQKTIYEDGEEVRYNCPNDQIYVKTQVKTCSSGQWVGPRSTCGYFIRNQISNIKVFDLSTNQTIVDMNSSNYTDDEYNVAYYDPSGTGLIINEAHRPLKWLFQYTNSMHFDFFLLNVRIPKSNTLSKVAINEIDAIRVKDVHIVTEPNRTCALDFTTRQKYAKIFWFWCTESNDKILSDSLLMSFTTYAKQRMESIGLSQVYLTKLQYCGHPPVPLLAKYIPQNEEIQCDPNIAIEVKTIRSVFDDLLYDSSHREYTDCIDNQYWAGNPKCIPKSYCELSLDNSTEEISFVKNAYIFNETEWYAIEGTTVHFNCKHGYEFVTDSMRRCLYNSTWDQSGPVCRESTNKESETSSFQSPAVLFPTIFVIIIVIVLVIVFIVVIMRRKKSLQNTNQRNPLENELDFYDDIKDETYNQYSEYNYGKSDEYNGNGYENPNDNQNKYELSNEKNVSEEQYYLALNDNKDNDYKGTTSAITQTYV